MEAEEGGGGSSLDRGGRREEDLRAEPRGNSASQSRQRLKLPGKWCTGLPAFLLPLCRMQLQRGTLRNPFLALGVRLREATLQPGGIGGTRLRPSRRPSPGPLYVRFGCCLRLYTPTPACWARTLMSIMCERECHAVSSPGLEAGGVGASAGS